MIPLLLRVRWHAIAAEPQSIWNSSAVVPKQWQVVPGCQVPRAGGIPAGTAAVRRREERGGAGVRPGLPSGGPHPGLVRAAAQLAGAWFRVLGFGFRRSPLHNIPDRNRGTKSLHLTATVRLSPSLWDVRQLDGASSSVIHAAAMGADYAGTAAIQRNICSGCRSSTRLR